MPRTRSLLVDTDFVRERAALLQIDRSTMRQRAGKAIGDKTIQRALNTRGIRLELESGAALAKILRCGCRDVYELAEPIDERIASFKMGPPALRAQEASRVFRVTRGDEAKIVAALGSRQAVVVSGTARSGKTDLARSVTTRMSDWFKRGAIWLDGTRDPVAQKVRVAECLGFYHPFPDGELLRRLLAQDFAQFLWARRRLLIIDELRDSAFLRALLVDHRGASDLLILTSAPELALELERELGMTAVHLTALPEHLSFALLLLECGDDHRIAPVGSISPEDLEALDRARQGDGSVVARCVEIQRRAVIVRPELRPLLEAIAGRPDAVRFVGDQLRLNPSATLASTADLIGGDSRAGVPLLRHVREPARRFFHRLAYFENTPIPVAWAGDACGVPSSDVLELARELNAVTRIDHESRICVLPYVLSAAMQGLGRDERAEVERRFFARVSAESRWLGSLPFESGLSALHASADAFLFCFRRALAMDTSTAPTTAPPVRSPLPILDAVVALHALLVTWRADEVQQVFEEAIRSARFAERSSDEAQLRLSLGRWLLGRRADFFTAETLFDAAACGFAALKLTSKAADALVEQGVSLFATRRVPAGIVVFRRTVATESGEDREPSPETVINRWNNLAFAESRLRRGRHKLDGWRTARTLLDRALGNAPASSTSSLSYLAAAHNRAIVAHVLGAPDARGDLKRCAGELLESKQSDDFVRAYVMATAIACEVVLVGDGLSDQRRQLQLYWRRLLDSRGLTVAHAIFRLGQMAYYLNIASAQPDGDVHMCNEGIMTTDATQMPFGWPHRELVPLMFHVEPVRRIFDQGYLDDAKRFVWEHGGPDQTRLFEELDAVLRHRD